MQEPDKLSAYYNNTSKKSFFFYRISIGASMLMLLIVLTVNLYVLNSNQQNDIRSRAASNENTNVVLPQLPQGCVYIASDKGYSVSCENMITKAPSVSPTQIPTPTYQTNQATGAATAFPKR